MPKKKKPRVDLTQTPGGHAERQESTQSETGFGPDTLFDDDHQKLASPPVIQGASLGNQERERPTLKSATHKFSKMVGLTSNSKTGKSSHSQSGGLPPTKDSQSGATAIDQHDTENIHDLNSSPLHSRTRHPVSSAAMSPSQESPSISALSTRPPGSQPLVRTKYFLSVVKLTPSNKFFAFYMVVSCVSYSYCSL